MFFFVRYIYVVKKCYVEVTLQRVPEKLGRSKILNRILEIILVSIYINYLRHNLYLVLLKCRLGI